MYRNITLTVIIFLLGAILGLNIQQNPSTDFMDEFSIDLPKTGNFQQIQEIETQLNSALETISSLETELSSATKERELLNTQLAQLNLQFETFSRPELDDAFPSTISPHEETLESTTIPSPAATVTMNNSLSDRSQKTLLMSIGVDESDADRILVREEQIEMEQLYLRNNAVREGWYGTEKYFEQSRNLEKASNVIREELGDDQYDQYLFKSGQSNRIAIVSVLSSSPAADANLQVGDVVVSYDNERVFSWTDLTQLTAQGTPGQAVTMTIERENQIQQIIVPRGPLGVRLSTKKIDPDAG